MGARKIWRDIVMQRKTLQNEKHKILILIILPQKIHESRVRYVSATALLTRPFQ